MPEPIHVFMEVALLDPFGLSSSLAECLSSASVLARPASVGEIGIGDHERTDKGCWRWRYGRWSRHRTATGVRSRNATTTTWAAPPWLSRFPNIHHRGHQIPLTAFTTTRSV